MLNKPLVIDINHNDPVTSFQKVKDFGIVGVIHKATEGLSFSDKLYPVRRKAFTDLGLKWGAYDFFHGDNPKAEADRFLSVAEPDKDTLVALDWERVPKGGDPSAAKARVWLERIEEKLGRKAVIYSGNVAKEQVKGKDAYFGSHRLWLAQYGTYWTIQASWTAPWLWQNNGDNSGPGPHHIAGITGLCDNNTIVSNDVDYLLKTWAS